MELSSCDTIADKTPGMELKREPGEQDLRTDLELVAAMNKGDSLAFEVLYYRYRDWAVNLAYRFTADRDLALDVMQETFLYFVKKSR